MGNKAKTQVERIAEYVEKHGSIDGDQALTIGVRRLPSRIHEMNGRYAMKHAHTNEKGLAVYVADYKGRCRYIRSQLYLAFHDRGMSTADLAKACHKASGDLAELALKEEV